MYIPKNHKEVQNMVLHFNVTKDKRKAMVQEDILLVGVEADRVTTHNECL